MKKRNVVGTKKASLDLDSALKMVAQSLRPAANQGEANSSSIGSCNPGPNFTLTGQHCGASGAQCCESGPVEPSTAIGQCD